jgi:ferrous iron transport protein B
MRLSDLNIGDAAIIIKVHGHGGFRKRITEMGFVRGQKVASLLNSPLKDPVKYSVMGYEVSLRRSEAEMIEILPEQETEDIIDVPDSKSNGSSKTMVDTTGNHIERTKDDNNKDNNRAVRKNIIDIALVGNPNSGKSSLFNALSGGSEHTGNYAGVTIGSKMGHFNYKNYHINITDLPGTYSISAYTPEEQFVRNHIFEKMPDIIINTVVASNLERNLYLTTELIDLNLKIVVALNMYDELENSGARLDYKKLGNLTGIPMVPTVAKRNKGLESLLDTIIDVFENRDKTFRNVDINYGADIEEAIHSLIAPIQNCRDLPQQFPPRYWALKLLENDMDAETALSKCNNFNQLKSLSGKHAKEIVNETGEDLETLISDAKYGFIAGALNETFTPGTLDSNKKTRYIDSLATNKWLGFPLFILFMWVMFMTTFTLGAYPQEWIELGVGKLGELISSTMSDGVLKDMLIDGIIGGAGSIIVFLPNILILYLFISFMEDTGYMSRAAFIMDKIMNRIGLHGKSFIPLIMGFGCNVPAIMAARTIESPSSRLITILINPFMSCSARIPVFLLLAGTFFPDNAGTVFLLLYLFGILIAVTTAKLLRKFMFKVEETPFVMELPPYRIPTLKSTLKHMWDKAKHYLTNIGTVVFVASIIIWFLSYFPRPVEEQSGIEQSYIGRIGKFIEPVMAPMGLNWKASVAIISGTAAKEVVVSTFGILYRNEDETSLPKTLAESNDFTPRSALALIVFILIYFPCIATLATIATESGSKKWVLFSIFYNTISAWILAFIIYSVAGFFIS